MSAELAERSAADLVRLHVSYSLTRDKRLRQELANAYAALTTALAREAGGGDRARQAARAGLLRAIDRYDVDRHGPFLSWAEARIRSDLRRLDDALPGPAGQLAADRLQVERTLDDLLQELGRSPTVIELAARSGLTEEQVLTAMELIGPHVRDQSSP